MEKSTIIAGIVTFIIGILIIPFLIFWLGWVAGWIATWVIGNPLTEGFSNLGISITKDQIPLIAGTIAWIGSILGTNKLISFNKEN